MQYFIIFKTNYIQSIFRKINCGLLAKPLKKFPKSGQPVLTFDERQICIELLNRVKIIKNLLGLFFIEGFDNDAISKSV